MSSQQYQLQISKLREFITYLRQFDEEIQRAVNGYRSRLKSLMDSGLPREVGQAFEVDFYKRSETLAKTNSALITEEAIPYAANHIKGLEQLAGR